MKSRLILLAALASTASGCKKEQPPAPAALPAQATAPAPSTSAPTPAPAPAKKNPLTEVPKADSTLSLLEPHEGRCEWLRMDPITQKRAVVASFEGDCKGARIAWTSDLSKALVWFDPAWVQSAGFFSRDSSPAHYPDEKPTPGAKPRLYEVTLASGETQSLPFPTVEGDLQTFGYKGGELLALSLKHLSEDQQRQPSITVDGHVLTFEKEGMDGVPALAYAWRISKDGPPQRVEVKTTSEGADLSLGVSALESSRGMGPRSTEVLDSHLHNAGPEPTEAQLAALLELVPAPMAQKVKTPEGAEEVSWAHGVTPAGSFFVWEIRVEFTHTTGHLVFEREGKLQPVKDLGFSDGEMVSVSAQGPFVLVSASDVGTHPRLYDLRTAQQVFRSDTARATTFWPSDSH